MDNSPCYIAFIDPIVSPAYLVGELHRCNMKVIGVFTLSLSEEEKRLYFFPELFDHVIHVDNDTSVNAIAEALTKLDVQYVFYGYEESVALADQIAQLVCPAYANDANISQLRYDKYEMQEALKKANMPYVKQIQLNSGSLYPAQVEELNSWEFPVMVKPSQGSGSENVKKCQSVNEIEIFIKKIEHNLSNVKNYIIQEFLSGDEYFVDTVSLSGMHQIVSVQHYQKMSFQGHPIYRYAEIVDPRSIEWKICCEFVLKALDAVGLKNGFGHTELFLTAEGPRLIEINPRISGAMGFPNKVAEKTLGYNQLKTLANIIFSHSYHSPTQLLQHGMFVCLQNWTPRKIKETNVELLKTIPSYAEHMMAKTPGTFLLSPKNLLDTVAYVLLLNPDNAQLMLDYNTLITLETKNALF